MSSVVVAAVAADQLALLACLRWVLAASERNTFRSLVLRIYPKTGLVGWLS
jgi:hypothetical protein